MKIYELRAIWREEHDCPDNGPTYICDAAETIAVQIDGHDMLDALVADLVAGFYKNTWSEERAKHLRDLYSGFDWMRDTGYEVRELSGFLVKGAQS